MDPRKRVEEAQGAYHQALQAAGARDDTQQRATEAYSAYVQVLQETWTEENQKRAAAAYAGYVQVLQEALSPELVRQRAEQAYREYVRAVKEAWNEADVDSLDAGSLAAIGQSTMTVAWTAATGAGEAAPGDGSSPLGAPSGF